MIYYTSPRQWELRGYLLLAKVKLFIICCLAMEKKQHTKAEDFYDRCNAAHHIYGIDLENMNKIALQDIRTNSRFCRCYHN